MGGSYRINTYARYAHTLRVNVINIQHTYVFTARCIRVIMYIYYIYRNGVIYYSPVFTEFHFKKVEKRK